MIVTLLFIVGCGSDVTEGENAVVENEETILETEEPVVEPDETEEVEEEIIIEDIPEELEEAETIIEVEEESGNALTGAHVIEITPNGFSPSTLNVNVGDTIEWKNTRTGGISGAMIIGVRSCSDIKSNVLTSGQNFITTISEAQTCTIVDGIKTTQTMKIIVEE